MNLPTNLFLKKFYKVEKERICLDFFMKPETTLTTKKDNDSYTKKEKIINHLL